jgi:hypothetical protein
MYDANEIVVRSLGSASVDEQKILVTLHASEEKRMGAIDWDWRRRAPFPAISRYSTRTAGLVKRSPVSDVPHYVATHPRVSYAFHDGQRRREESSLESRTRSSEVEVGGIYRYLCRSLVIHCDMLSCHFLSIHTL